MSNYRSPVDVQNAQDFSAGSAFGSVGQLAKLLQQKQLAGQAQQHDESQLRLQAMLRQQGQEEAQAQSITRMRELAQQYPGMGISVTPEGASIHPPAAVGTYDLKAERNRIKIIRDVVDDYRKTVGTQPKRIMALNAVREALAKGDIASLGQLKAQLPILEGESYKPTDKERELMIAPTAAGTWAKAKNFVGLGDNIPLSDVQRKALADFVERKIVEERDVAKRAKDAVTRRWHRSISSLDRYGLEDLEDSLGRESTGLLTSIEERQHAGNPSATVAQPGLDSNAVDAELKRRGLK